MNGSLAGGVPGGPGQRDVVDGVEFRLRPEAVPLSITSARARTSCGGSAVELAEGLPLHDVGCVDGQPVSSALTAFPASALS